MIFQSLKHILATAWLQNLLFLGKVCPKYYFKKTLLTKSPGWMAYRFFAKNDGTKTRTSFHILDNLKMDLTNTVPQTLRSFWTKHDEMY